MYATRAGNIRSGHEPREPRTRSHGDISAGLPGTSHGEELAADAEREVAEADRAAASAEAPSPSGATSSTDAQGSASAGSAHPASIIPRPSSATDIDQSLQHAKRSRRKTSPTNREVHLG